MGYAKKEHGDGKKFYFTPEARRLFASEMEGFKFDFDRFLEAKRATGKSKNGSLVAIQYETEDQRADYRSKFVNGTKYYSFDIVKVEDMFKVPMTFWQELREQCMSEESSAFWKVAGMEEARTGKSHNERAKEKIAEMRSGVSDIMGKMQLPKYDLKEYGNADYI